jgi:hypothetical protein
VQLIFSVTLTVQEFVMKFLGAITVAAMLGLSTAHAADLPLKAPAIASSTGGWFGYIQGQNLFDPLTNNSDNNAPGNAPFSHLGSGWGGSARLGYLFASRWDVAFGVSYGDYRQGPRTAAGGSWQPNDGKLWYTDGDVGYHFGGPGYDVRPFVGVRYVNWHFAAFDSNNGYNFDGRSSNIGPHIGVQAMRQISGPWSIFGGLDTSFLFGTQHDTTGPAFALDNSYRKTVWQVGGEIGVDWLVASQVHLAAGYKINYWSNIQAQYGIDTLTGGPFVAGGGNAPLLEHGVFARLGFGY